MGGLSMGTEAWLWIGVWALVLITIVSLLVHEPARKAPRDPETILRERFARGELTEDEFRRASEALAADHAEHDKPRRLSQ